MQDQETIKDFIIKLPIATHSKIKSICAFRHISMRQFFLEAAVEKIEEHDSFQ